MIHVKKQQLKKKEVERVFNSIKNNDLLEDRMKYDEEDLQSTYPHLNKKEVKLLYLKIQKCKYSKRKNSPNLASKMS